VRPYLKNNQNIKCWRCVSKQWSSCLISVKPWIQTSEPPKRKVPLQISKCVRGLALSDCWLLSVRYPWVPPTKSASWSVYFRRYSFISPQANKTLHWRKFVSVIFTKYMYHKWSFFPIKTLFAFSLKKKKELTVNK
jgi:hypothetical protein